MLYAYTRVEELAFSSNKVEANQEKKKIAITFDDGPSAKYTEKLLDELKKEM